MGLKRIVTGLEALLATSIDQLSEVWDWTDRFI